MSLSLEEVQRLASLAKLDLAQTEQERMAVDLEKVLGFVARLSQVDTAGIPEMETIGGQRPLRPDVVHVQDEDVRDMIVKNFPDRAGEALRVPAVFEKPKG